MPFGLLSDRWGRKPIILIGLILFTLGSFLAAMSTDILGIVLGRFLQGCGAIAGVLLALLADLTRIDQRSKAMAIVGVAIGASFGIAMVLGPFIAFGHGGLRGIFVTTGLLGSLSLLLVLLLIPTPRLMTAHLDTMVYKDRLRAVLTDKALWRANASVFILHYLLISAFTVLPLLLRGTGNIEDTHHSTYYLVLLAGAFLLMSPMMWFADRVGDMRLVIIGMILLVVAGLQLLGMGDYWPVLAGLLLFFMGFSLMEVLLPVQLSKLASAGFRGTAMGVYTSCQFLGVFAGGLVGGWILSHADITTLLYANIAVCGLWVWVTLTFPRLDHIGSRTVNLGNLDKQSAKAGAEALLSVRGVMEAAIVEAAASKAVTRETGETVAYLKVDESRLDDHELTLVSTDFLDKRSDKRSINKQQG